MTLCRREREWVEPLPPNLRRLAFARLWVRKEAYVKGDGRGLELALDRIDASAEDGSLLVYDGSEGRWAASRRWRVLPLRVRPGYAGALALEGDGWRLRARSWPSG